MYQRKEFLFLKPSSPICRGWYCTEGAVQLWARSLPSPGLFSYLGNRDDSDLHDTGQLCVACLLQGGAQGRWKKCICREMHVSYHHVTLKLPRALSLFK